MFFICTRKEQHRSWSTCKHFVLWHKVANTLYIMPMAVTEYLLITHTPHSYFRPYPQFSFCSEGLVYVETVPVVSTANVRCNRHKYRYNAHKKHILVYKHVLYGTHIYTYIYRGCILLASHGGMNLYTVHIRI